MTNKEYAGFIERLDTIIQLLRQAQPQPQAQLHIEVDAEILAEPQQHSPIWLARFTQINDSSSQESS